MLALSVVIAVLVMQTFGLMHRIVHADRLGHAADADEHHEATAAVLPPNADLHAEPHADPGDDPHRSGVSSAGNFVTKLFAGHHGHDCDRFDQASHSYLAPGFAFGLPDVLPPQPRLGSHPYWHIAALACGFLARAPPVRA